MSRELDVLRAVWPEGIPISDYERALRLLATLGIAPAATLPSAAPPAREAQRPRRTLEELRGQVSEATQEHIRKELERRPATARALAQTTGYDETTVYAALKLIGAEKAGKGDRRDGGNGLRPTIYRLRGMAPVIPLPVPSRAARKPYRGVYVSRVMAERVRAALGAGPATAGELVDALDTREDQVRAALRRIGAQVIGVREVKGKRGKAAQVWALAEENSATP